MARELVLLPKAKYDKLMSDETKRKTKEVDTQIENEPEKSKKMGTQTENKPEKQKTVNEEKSIQDKSTNPLNNVTNSEQTKKQKDTDKIPGQSKRAQRGGKLYIKTTPSDFMMLIPKKQAKRKWLSFKI